MIDLLDMAVLESKIGEHGSVMLVDMMPRCVPIGQKADYAIIQAARVSYGLGMKTPEEDANLIRYLYRHRHTTPFEMVELKFRCVMPIFVARQWIRHRTASVNEYSGRYSIVKDRYYRPSVDQVRSQSKTNKQGSEGTVDLGTAERFLEWLDDQAAQQSEYEMFVGLGIAKEMARIGLPVSLFTEWYWKIDLHNLFHFLGLRMDSHAQSEIREYATAMFSLVQPMCPVAAQAFLDYHPNMGGMLLSAAEIRLISTGVDTLKGREKAEFDAKALRLGL